MYIEYVMKKTGIFLKYPYNINYEKTLYNSVGGCALRDLSEKEEIKSNLKKALYISVRDRSTFEELQDIGSVLTPDSAVLISDIWKRELLKKTYDSKYKMQNEYVVFQTGGNRKAWELDAVIKVIKSLYKEKGISTVLLPLGRTISHCDMRWLKKIKNKTVGMSRYYDNITLKEMTYLLSESSGFIGTSLHGNIVAMSYGKQSFLITRENTKNWWYWNTWLKDSSCRITSFEDLSTDIRWLEQKADTKLVEEHKKLINLQFMKMAERMRQVL